MTSYFEFSTDNRGPLIQNGLFNRATSFKLLGDVSKPSPVYACRWMIRRDFQEVVNMMARNKSQTEKGKISKKIEHLMLDPNVLGLVCEKDGHIIGFLIFEATNTYYQLLILNTKSEPKKVIESLLSRIMDKLGSQGYPRQKCRIIARDNQDGPIWWYKLLKDFGFDGRKVSDEWVFTYYSQKGFEKEKED